MTRGDRGEWSPVASPVASGAAPGEPGPALVATPLRWPHTIAAHPEPGPLRPELSRPALEVAAHEQGREQGRSAGLAEGRAAGLAETAALRDQLASLCEALREHRRESLVTLGEAVVDVAMLIIEVWLEHSEPDRRARLAPVVARWVHDVGAVAAVAEVAAGDVAAMREAVGELPIEVREDLHLAAGDVRLRGERMAIELRWRERLGELRGELVATLAARWAAQEPSP